MKRSGIVLFAVTAVVALSGWMPSASSAAPARCFGEDATIVGTQADETIRGTAGADVILGGGGNDKIYGRGGLDRICSYFSGDEEEPTGSKLFGGGGDDLLRGDLRLAVGGTGGDLLRPRFSAQNRPGPGDDIVVGPREDPGWVSFKDSRRGVVVNLQEGTAVGQGHDDLKRIRIVTGSNHADTVVGRDSGPSLLIGRKGSDLFVGHGGRVLAAGGDGDDSLRGGPDRDIFWGGHGSDVFVGHGGRNVAVGGDGDDSLRGGPDRDVLVGGDGNDALFGRADNDLLAETRPGANLILGGGGDRDNCFGSYRVPPNVERGCERHNQPPGFRRQEFPRLVGRR